MVEVGTGLGLILLPNQVAWLIFGVDLNDLTDVMGRIAGIALLSLAIGCAPSAWVGRRAGALAAMLSLNAMLFIYFGVLGIFAHYDGWLFWPAFALHGLLAAGMAVVWYRQRLRERVEVIDN